MARNQQTIEELAKSVQLPRMVTKDVIKRLKFDILLSMYRYEPETEWDHEVNKKVAGVYKKYSNSEFKPEIHMKNKNISLFLMGPPGQGKTSSYQVAAKEVCNDLGFRFIPEVTDNYIPKKEDFVMVVQECAGENSAITFGGVPKAEEVEINGKKMSVLKKAVNYRFTVFEQCAGGVLLFDDAANAATVIQNVLLPIAQFHTFQGLAIKNACVGFTGNLGSLDGTYTSELSSALRTRVRPMFVTDTVKDFVLRGYHQYNDELGDLGFSNFLLRDEKKFSVLPDPSSKTGFACPRSWDNAIQQCRSAVEFNGGRGVGEEAALPEIHSIVTSCLGPEIGHELVSYFNSFMRGADPLAREFLKIESTDKKGLEEGIKKLQAKYKNGTSAEDLSFGYQFATACGDYATNAITSANDPKKALEEVTRRFGNAVFNLGDSELSYAVEHFKNKLIANVPEFAVANKNSRDLKSEYQEKIAMTLSELEGCGKAQIKAIVAVLTDYAKVAKSSDLLMNNKSGARKSLR